MTLRDEAWATGPVSSAGNVARLTAKLPSIVGLTLVIFIQATLVFNRAINWDEYWHYSLVHLLDRGILFSPLQTFFIRLSQDLLLLPGSAVDHIVVARLFMLGCEFVAAWMIARLASRFTDWPTGLLAALGYLSASFVLQHGFSFRADPALTALGMSALCVLGCTRFRGMWVFAFAALLALAALFSIKIILYAPCFAAIAWLRWYEERFSLSLLLRLAVAGGVTLALFFLLFLYHSSAGVVVDTGAGTVLSRSAQRMFLFGVPPYWSMIVKFAVQSPAFVMLVLLFPVALRRSSLGSAAKVALSCLLLPLCTLAFYHNTAPYYYTFMLAPVAVATAVPLGMIVRRYGATLPAMVFSIFAAMLWTQEDFRIIDRQRALHSAIDQIFPQRISYFDFCAMLARHDKANTFMTPFMGAVYRRGGISPMTRVMADKVVPLVVENDPMFSRLLRTGKPVPEFLPQDAAAVRDTYIQFWGPFWVAGRHIPAGARDMSVEFRVPGPYTLSGGSIEIDGRTVTSGSVVHLDRGAHRLTALEDKSARLLWGDHLRLPEGVAPPQPHWVYF